MHMDVLPNSCNKKDLVHGLDPLKTDEFYYLVYTKSKTNAQLQAEHQVSGVMNAFWQPY